MSRAFDHLRSLPYTFQARVAVHHRIQTLEDVCQRAGISEPSLVYKALSSGEFPQSWMDGRRDPALITTALAEFTLPVVRLGAYLSADALKTEQDKITEAIEMLKSAVDIGSKGSTYAATRLLVAYNMIGDGVATVRLIKKLLLSDDDKVPDMELRRACLSALAGAVGDVGGGADSTGSSALDMKSLRENVFSVLHRLDESVVVGPCCDEAGAVARVLLPKYAHEYTPMRALSHPFFRAHLRNQIYMGGDALLVPLRKQMLSKCADGSCHGENEAKDVVETIAIQVLLAGYPHAMDDDERTLLDDVCRQLSSSSPVEAVLAIAMYKNIWRTPFVDVLATGTKLALLDRLKDIDVEISLQPKIRRVTLVEDETSLDVQDFYEDNIYPVWRCVQSHGNPTYSTMSEFIRLHFGTCAAVNKNNDMEERMLIAGSGSGHHAAVTMATFKNTHVTALDLSLANCAYATRQLGTDPAVAPKHRYEICCGDIMELSPSVFGGENYLFDVIDCVGTLHHLGGPTAGLRRLCSVLKPGGFLSLAVYSKVGTEGAERVKAWLREHGLVDGASVPEMRNAILSLPLTHPIRLAATSFMSFYTTPTFRDTFLHPSVHMFDLPEVRRLAVEECGLDFVGVQFSGLRADIQARAEYLNRQKLLHRGIE
eukprot:PhM_4_TR12002/c0_g1_i1/m.52671